MSRRPAKPKPPTTVYIPSNLHQPESAKMWALRQITGNMGEPVMVLTHLFVRLLIVLVGRKKLNPPDFYYIITGVWSDHLTFADWSPDQELEEGLQPGVILER